MKIKKQITIGLEELQIGDEIAGVGSVVFIYDPGGQWRDVVYIDLYSDELDVNSWRTVDSLDVIREVETPETVDILTKYGDTLRVGNDAGGDIWIDLLFPDGESRLGGKVIEAKKLIDAIKAVKGLD
jgi:hypothetical protein